MIYFIHPKKIATGIAAKIIGTTIEKSIPVFLINPLYFGWFHPMVWKAEGKP